MWTHNDFISFAVSPENNFKSNTFPQSSFCLSLSSNFLLIQLVVSTALFRIPVGITTNLKFRLISSKTLICYSSDFQLCFHLKYEVKGPGAHIKVGWLKKRKATNTPMRPYSFIVVDCTAARQWVLSRMDPPSLYTQAEYKVCTYLLLCTGTYIEGRVEYLQGWGVILRVGG